MFEVGDSTSRPQYRRYLSGILILCILPVFIISTNTTSELLASRQVSGPYAHWEIQDLGNYSDYDFTKIMFLNETHGWVIGWGILLSTNDGGYTWSTLLETRTLIGLSLVNSNEIWVGGSGRLYHSNDSGSSWTSSIGPTELPTNVEFYNATHGIAGDVNGVFLTTDGGNNWQNVTMASGHDIPKDFHLTSTTVWIASRLGIFRSDDWGENWFVEYDGYAGALDFITEEEGWSINWYNSLAYFNGDYWTDLEDIRRLGVSSSSYSYDIDFVDSNHGWVVGKNPSVAYTPDSGETWYEQEWYDEDYNAPRFRSVDFINETHGWAAGWDGVIARTTTGNLLGAQLYTGLFLQSPFTGGGRLIPYTSLLVGVFVTAVYTTPWLLWTLRSRSQRRKTEQRDAGQKEFDPFSN